jgi:hypothetical protein
MIVESTNVENMHQSPAFAKPLLAEVPLVVSFSGGRTSAFMARALQLRYEGKRDLIFIFANTGKERIETHDFINECETRWNLNCVWLEYDLVEDKSTFKIVDYNSASRNGEPFEKMISKYGLPNKAFPHCTRELKRQTITRYLRTIGLNNGKYETAIGIRIDEAHRINWQNAKRDRFIYPLATDFRATKDFIRTWWDRQDFDLQLKDYEGNCDMCWKKSERKLLTMILENPHLLDWWNEMEIKFGNPNGTVPFTEIIGYDYDEEYDEEIPITRFNNGDRSTFFRKWKSAQDLLELSKQKFRKANDEHEANKQQEKLFDYDLDIEYDCFCKSS